jgi:hypothetical protein
MGDCADFPDAVDWRIRGNPVIEKLGLHRGAEREAVKKVVSPPLISVNINNK